MKSFRLGLAAIILSVLLPAPSAWAGMQSATESVATCTAEWLIDFGAPGVNLTPRSVTMTTHGETGTVNCLGKVKGGRVTGKGKTGTDGTYNGSTAGGSGSEIVSMTIPTTAASEPQKVSFSTRLTVGPGLGFKESDSLVGPGVFVFLPTKGDGVISPITQILVVAQFTVRS